jgi:hypothetical protein
VAALSTELILYSLVYGMVAHRSTNVDADFAHGIRSIGNVRSAFAGPRHGLEFELFMYAGIPFSCDQTC